jgi:SAM-dependent methyltransferase
VAEAYGTLAEVYEFLVPEALLEPGDSAAAFAPVVDGLPPGARVLDCACGIGALAVGLAQRGFAVAASDASTPMVERTRALAAAHGVALEAEVRRWEDLEGPAVFDAVFCVGNSLTHARERRAALAGMARVLRPGGLLALTSRNWELLREQRPEPHIDDQLTERGGRRALVGYSWTLPDDWDDHHYLDIAVVEPAGEGHSRRHAERLEFCPFRHETLDEDLRACGLTPATSTWAPDVERYLVTARRD